MPSYHITKGNIMQSEEWKDIAGYEGLYQISNLGRIKSFHKWRGNKEYITNGYPNKDGYMKIDLIKNGKKQVKSIHTLVLNTFLGIQPNKDCNHKNGVKFDNHLENLEYCTKSENVKHAYSNLGKVSTLRGENNWTSKITENDAREIKRLYATGKYLQREIGQIFDITQAAVSLIVTEKNWKHLKSD